MKRENLELNPFTAWYILAEDSDHRDEDDSPEDHVEESKKYKLVESELIGSDEEDGGWEKEVVIQRLSDNKFFSTTYQQWDVDWEKGDIESWSPEFLEVYPENKTITIYK